MRVRLRPLGAALAIVGIVSFFALGRAHSRYYDDSPTPAWFDALLYLVAAMFVLGLGLLIATAISNFRRRRA